MFIIMEIQTNNGIAAIVTPIQTAQTQNEAFSNYHSILAVAATSNVECHTAMILNERGEFIARESFEHPSGE